MPLDKVAITITDQDLATALADPDLGLQLKYIALLRMVGERDAELVKLNTEIVLLHEQMANVGKFEAGDITLEPEATSNGRHEEPVGTSEPNTV